MPDEIMMQETKGKAKPNALEEGCEIQGTAELSITPSKIAVMKSDTALDLKYKALASSESIPGSRGGSAEDSGSRENGHSNNGQRHAAGNSNSITCLNEEMEFEKSSLREPLEIASKISDDENSYAKNSHVTIDNPSAVYPTAITCSFGMDSFNSWKSVEAVSDSFWSKVDDSQYPNSVSTAISLPDSSEAQSKPSSVQSFSPIEMMTAELFTDDLNTAEACESNIEATNCVFDAVLDAKSKKLNQMSVTEIETAVSSDLITPSSCLEDWDNWKSPESHLSPFDSDNIRTAISHSSLEAKGVME
ncbi:hypothetical protein KIN20_038006 [Parelaphostrongylus tenuis]|uniref:Uncharacterized protein n=1 Tax=Parelaphostrongylus tenuis TaxID=148309 RepID=A0AAD5REM9_PARTN|nr:hypothetical protein KIN20_038006 [Parelaphostrongylus tenuis]